MRNSSTSLLLAALLSAALPQAAAAQEYWGKFEDPLEGRFENAQPRPVFVLSKQFRFLDPNGLRWTVPQDAKVDGASIPQAFWSVIGGPFEGAYLNASVVHDYYCDTKSRTAHDTHRNFYYGMLANGVPSWKAKVMHWAVATFGPDWKIVRRIVPSVTCGGSGIACMSVALSVTKVEVSASPNLEDPQVLALALSKFAATAKTLKTSNGEVLDVGEMGQVDASLDSIEANAQAYRKLLASEDLNERLDELGVLSDPNAANLDTITPWSNNRVPTPAELKPYQANVPGRTSNVGFTVKQGDLDAIARSIDLNSLSTQLDVGGPRR